MQSDTVIGIVGAVVLVAVMVGVFAYEYNNAPETGDDGPDLSTDAGKMEAFAAMYPGLNATDDLDGDGMANYNDTDIDDDGIVNEDDNITCFCDQTFSGTVAQRTPNTNPADTSNTFTIFDGADRGTVEVSWQPTQVGGTTVAQLVVSITGPGDVSCDNSADDGATCDLAAAVPGTYTIEVRHAQQAGQETDFDGTYSIFY